MDSNTAIDDTVGLILVDAYFLQPLTRSKKSVVRIKSKSSLHCRWLLLSSSSSAGVLSSLEAQSQSTLRALRQNHSGFEFQFPKLLLILKQDVEGRK